MTTIACDGKMIAADGLVTGNGFIHDRTCKKVFRLHDGRVVAFSGSAFDIAGAVDYLNGVTAQFSAEEGFEAVILSADGTVQCMDEKTRLYAQSVPCVSGSGGAIALGAMAAGKDAFEAVKIAAELDTHSGGVCSFLIPTEGDADHIMPPPVQDAGPLESEAA